jgi:hypothetical protein
VTTQAALAGDALTTALLEAARQRLRPHCSDAGSWLWLSDNAADRAEAARLRVGCPIFNPCGQAAEARGERFGVWAGRDFTRKPHGTAGRPVSESEVSSETLR